MRFFYDRKSDSLYLGLSEHNEYRDSVEAAPGVVLDFDEAGRLLGIDLERASRLMDVSDLELHEEPSGTDVETARLDGGKLRKERERIGLSQLELARKLSVSTNTIARWERGELRIEHPGMLQLALRSLRLANRPTSTRVNENASRARQIVRSTMTGRLREPSPAKSARKTAGRTTKKKRAD